MAASECPCDWCKGTGKDGPEKCYTCGGTGKKRPRCSVCGEPALEGKATCGMWQCSRDYTRALEQRRRRKVFGAPLELVREAVGGWRHYLVGKPVQCGAGLELYADDPTNPETYLQGRYEANLATSGHAEPTVWFCTAVGDVRVNLHLAHFRWPGRSSATVTMRMPNTCTVCNADGPGVGPSAACPRLGCAGTIR